MYLYWVKKYCRVVINIICLWFIYINVMFIINLEFVGDIKGGCYVIFKFIFNLLKFICFGYKYWMLSI